MSPETGRFSPSERDQSPCLAETSPPPPHSSPSSLMTGSPGSPQLLLRPVPLHPSTSPSSSPLDLTSPARSYNMGMVSPVPLSTLMQQPLRPAEIPASVQYPLGIPGRGKFIASMFRVKWLIVIFLFSTLTVNISKFCFWLSSPVKSSSISS